MDVETPLPRSAGVCLHLTSLPGNYGIGEIGDHAKRFIHTLAAMDLRVWQFLPIGPTAYGDSPYQPLSTFAGNEMLVDIEQLIGLGLLAKESAAELAKLPADRTDYGRLIPIKQMVLREAAQRFTSHATPDLRAQYADFLTANNTEWLHDYALFRVLKTRHNERPWPEWEPEFARRDAGSLQRLEGDAAADIETVKIVQFFFYLQWNELHTYATQHNVLLMGDMPFYIALDSADAWVNPELLLISREGIPECVAGVPPDYFSDDGQLWGNPIYDWNYHADTHYAWWVRRMRHALTCADLVRIDHFRGFEAFWSIPAGEDTARNGAWKPGPGGAIFDALKRELGSLPVIAEDLGVITPEVEALRNRYRCPGMKVLQFEVAAKDFEIADINAGHVCYTGTHDNDTTVGWFLGGPGDTRTPEEIAATQAQVLEVTGGSAETLHLDMLRLAFSSDAALAVAPLQDFLGLDSTARLNTPGTTGNNWRWRLLPEQLTVDHSELIKEMVRDSSRGLI